MFFDPLPFDLYIGVSSAVQSRKELALSISLETTAGAAAFAHGPIKSTKWNKHQNLMMLHVETSDVHTVWLLSLPLHCDQVLKWASCACVVGKVVGKVALRHMVLLPASTFIVCRAIVVYTH